MPCHIRAPADPITLLTHMAIVDPRLHRSNAVIHDAAPNGGEGDAVEIAPWHATQRHFVAGAAKSMGNMSDMTD